MERGALDLARRARCEAERARSARERAADERQVGRLGDREGAFAVRQGGLRHEREALDARDRGVLPRVAHAATYEPKLASLVRSHPAAGAFDGAVLRPKVPGVERPERVVLAAEHTNGPQVGAGPAVHLDPPEVVLDDDIGHPQKRRVGDVRAHVVVAARATADLGHSAVLDRETGPGIAREETVLEARAWLVGSSAVDERTDGLAAPAHVGVAHQHGSATARRVAVDGEDHEPRPFQMRTRDLRHAHATDHERAFPARQARGAQGEAAARHDLRERALVGRRLSLQPLEHHTRPRLDAEGGGPLGRDPQVAPNKPGVPCRQQSRFTWVVDLEVDRPKARVAPHANAHAAHAEAQPSGPHDGTARDIQAAREPDDAHVRQPRAPAAEREPHGLWG